MFWVHASRESRMTSDKRVHQWVSHDQGEEEKARIRIQYRERQPIESIWRWVRPFVTLRNNYRRARHDSVFVSSFLILSGIFYEHFSIWERNESKAATSFFCFFFVFGKCKLSANFQRPTHLQRRFFAPYSFLNVFKCRFDWKKKHWNCVQEDTTGAILLTCKICEQ